VWVTPAGVWVPGPPGEFVVRWFAMSPAVMIQACRGGAFVRIPSSSVLVGAAPFLAGRRVSYCGWTFAQSPRVRAGCDEYHEDFYGAKIGIRTKKKVGSNAVQPAPVA